MPRYRIHVDEVRQLRREYVVEAEDEAAAREYAAAGETVAESDDGRYVVVDRHIIEVTSQLPSLCVILESEPYGRETFDHYSDLDEMLEAVERMVQTSLDNTAADGIARTVGITIIPPSGPEESDDATADYAPG